MTQQAGDVLLFHPAEILGEIEVALDYRGAPAAEARYSHAAVAIDAAHHLQCDEWGARVVATDVERPPDIFRRRDLDASAWATIGPGLAVQATHLAGEGYDFVALATLGWDSLRGVAPPVSEAAHERGSCICSASVVQVYALNPLTTLAGLDLRYASPRQLAEHPALRQVIA